MSKYRDRVIILLLLVSIVLRPGIYIFQQQEKFFSRGYEKQYESYKNAYYSSQYVKKKNPSIIPDETFESFAGGAFLKGLSPILIVHDHPPLGRYIIALSILLFDNQNTIIIPLLVISLIGLYLLSRMTIQNNIFALIPLAVFTNEKLFLDKLVYTPLPEPVQFPFIIFSLYAFLVAVDKKKNILWFIVTAILLGCVISIRFFVLGGAIVVAMVVFLLLDQKKRKLLVPFLISLPVSLVVLIGSYFRTIESGYSIRQIIGIQKYILEYHKSKFILPFSFWDLILFNRWHTWWGNNAIITDTNWIISWPISIGIIVGGFIQCIVNRLKFTDTEKLLLLWVIAYSLVLSTGYTSTRYFFALIPFFYIIAVSFIYKFWNKKMFKNK